MATRRSGTRRKADTGSDATPSDDGRSPDGARHVQQQLRALGLKPGQVDGRFGPQTKEALTEFQESRNLATDGVYGQQAQNKFADALVETGEGAASTEDADRG